MNRAVRKWMPLLFALVAVSCARPIVTRCTDPADNPVHHFVQGMEAVERGELKAAQGKFERALYCDDRYSPTYAGRALVYAEQATRQPDARYREADVARALSDLKQAKRLGRSREDEFIYHTTAIRVLTALRSRDWLADAEGHFEKAKAAIGQDRNAPYYGGRESASYFLALAYSMTGQEFGKARRLLQDVLSVKPVGPWHARADVAWKQLDRTERAIAGVTLGNVGKGLAVKDSLGRAQVAVLLVDELKLDAIFSGDVRARGRPEGTGFIPVDLVHHPFQEEVRTILRWNVRGLEPLYDRSRQAYLFKPEDPLTRKEFAVVLEDLLVKISRDAQQASAFVGHDHSPFPDVRSTAPWYNAIVTAVTRGLMETGSSGEFYPDKPIDGTQVLLALRALRRWFG